MQGRVALPLEECNKGLLPLVGGKNANLGELMRAGIPVPPGFAITTEAYDRFLTESGIKDRIASRLSKAKPDDISSLEAASAELRQIIESSDIPEDITEAILKAYQRLSEICDVHDVYVAVRSSATAEDLPEASFAGQQDTYLWIRGAEALLDRVKRCMSSLYTARAISYRIERGIPHEKVSISIGVQKMVNAKVAGVMFTLNPLDGDRSRIVIDASWGLGEGVVSGEVTPDSYKVSKITGEIEQRKPGPKAIQYVFDPDRGEVVRTEVPQQKRSEFCLSDREIEELARLAKLIEEHFGCPQDIEWAIDQDLPFPQNVFILQSRPETVWTPKQRGPVLERKGSFIEQALSVTLKAKGGLFGRGRG